MNGFLVVVVFALPLLAMWLGALVEVVRRRDLGSAGTVGWLLALVLIPVLSLAVYLVARPPRSVRTSGGRADEARAEAIVLLAERRQRGELGDAEFRAEVTAITES